MGGGVYLAKGLKMLLPFLPFPFLIFLPFHDLETLHPGDPSSIVQRGSFEVQKEGIKAIIISQSVSMRGPPNHSIFNMVMYVKFRGVHWLTLLMSWRKLQYPFFILTLLALLDLWISLDQELSTRDLPSGSL